MNSLETFPEIQPEGQYVLWDFHTFGPTELKKDGMNQLSSSTVLDKPFLQILSSTKFYLFKNHVIGGRRNGILLFYNKSHSVRSNFEEMILQTGRRSY